MIPMFSWRHMYSILIATNAVFAVEASRVSIYYLFIYPKITTATLKFWH